MTWEGREILCFLYPEDEDPGEDDAENVDEGQGQADQKQNPNIVIQARINNFGELPPPPYLPVWATQKATNKFLGEKFLASILKTFLKSP